MNDFVSIPTIQEPVREQTAIPMVKDEKIQDWQEKTIPPVEVKNESLLWPRPEEISELKARWNAIQVKFIDQPGASVEQADALMVDVLKRIETVLSNGRTTLNEQWVNQQDVSTENLRIVLQNYRKFFNQLLAL